MSTGLIVADTSVASSVASMESQVASLIRSNIPEIEKHRLRPPAKFADSAVSDFGYFRADSGEQVSFVSKGGYEMTTHDDYIALATAGLTAMSRLTDGEFSGNIRANWSMSRSFAEATIIIEPSDDERRSLYDIGGHDAIWPRLIIRAPFGRPFSVVGGFFRDACRNLDIPQIAGASFNVSIRHTSQLRDRMPDLIECCNESATFDTMVESVRNLNETQVVAMNAIRDIYPEPERESDSKAGNTWSRWNNRVEAIRRRIDREQAVLRSNVQEGYCSAFQLIEACTGYIQHEKSRRNSPDETGRMVLALNDTDNANVWAYAEACLAS